MKRFVIFLLIGFAFTGCVSRAKYNELMLQKEKAASKTVKLEEKLNTLRNYNQHLQDSLNNQL